MALDYNFIAELYLPKMDITILHHMFDGCLVELKTKNSQSEKQHEGFFSIIIKSKSNEE